ncbi:MAG: efflux RND transporter periplasmic adaptor subunit [Deltaproteobacteria bacterium]|nr:efflux RND transporter periplasmic adaptor subunit [Deltaproteobacteria bacterium]
MKTRWSVIVLLLAPGCGAGSAPEAEGHESEAPEVAIGITKWSERYELFAEHPAPVAGREASFTAHLTTLDGFRALERGTVALELEGPAPIRASIDHVLRPGIFKLAFTPRAAGSYRGRLVVQVDGSQDVIGPFEMDVYPDAAAAHRAHPGGEDPPGRITFLKEQQWRVPFGTAFAAEGEVTPTVEVPGSVGTPPGGAADIGAPVAGRVVAPPEGLPERGTEVRRGAILVTVAPAPSSPEASATVGLAVAEAEARVAAAQTALERAERLFADRAISQREVEAARREVEVGRAAAAAARRSQAIFSGVASGTGAGSVRITAPIDGVVIEVSARPGQSVAAGDILLRVVDPRVMWITARVPEVEAARVDPSRDPSYRILGIDEWLPLDVTPPDATGEVVTIGRVVDPESRTVPVVYALHAPDPRLRIGGAVQVQLPAGEPWRGVVIPSGALVDDDGRPVVYLQAEGEAFEERIVRIGPTSGGRVAVLDGLRAEERIVTIGANLVRLAGRAGTVPAHGHVH